ncbi:MAG: phage terminase large subunit [Chloroflexota bacterium]
MTPSETKAALVEQIGLHHPHLVGIEEAAYRQAVTRDVIQRASRRVGGVGSVPVKPSTDKVTRALLPAARAEAGLVYADRQAPWWPAFEAECLAFPLGSHDDQVDALSGAVQRAVEKVGVVERKRQTYQFGQAAKRQPDWLKEAFGGGEEGILGR